MTTIDRLRGLGRIAASRTSPAGAAPFGWLAPSPGDDAAPVQPGAPVAGLDSLLALQERQGDAAADRRARRHGQAILAGLASLQRGLLRQDGSDQADLAGLATLCDQLPFAADQGLRLVLQSIALRARIELARAA